MKQKIVLSPYTFIWRVGADVLLYGSQNYNYVRVKNASKDICLLCDEILSNVLYFTFYEAGISHSVDSFLKQVEEKSLGRIVNEKSSLISIRPELSIQDNALRIKENRSFNYRLLDYLHTVEFYVGGKSEQIYYNDQIVSPIISDEKLTPLDVDLFLSKCSSSGLTRVNILFTENDSSFLPSISSILNEWRDLVTIYSVFSGEEDFQFIQDIADSNFKQRVIIDSASVSKKDDIRRLFSILKNHHSVVDFIVKSVSDLSFVESVSDDLLSDGVTICFSPVSNNNNEFIAQYVQLSETEILESKLTKRNVFIHQSINVNNWGTLSVRPDKSVSIDSTSRSIGNISDSIYDLIVSALSDDMWLRIRNDIECRKCVFRWLCPSPTRLETAFYNRKICNFR